MTGFTILAAKKHFDNFKCTNCGMEFLIISSMQIMPLGNSKVYLFVRRICGVVVSLVALGAVDHGFKSRSDQTKDYKIGVCCFFSKHSS